MPEPPITLVAGLPPLPLVATCALLFFLPGYAVGSLLLPAARYSAVERLLAAPALTLASLALLTLWASVLHVPLGPPAALVLLGASLGLLVWSWLAPSARARSASVARGLVPRLGRPATPAGTTAAPAHAPFRQTRQAPDHPTALTVQDKIGAKQITPLAVPGEALVAAGYLALFLLALGLRLWSTRDILPTLGADTYHHTLIARLIVDRGALPDSYVPYAPIQSFAYHFGFHSLVAWLHWWTGADVGTLVGLAGHLVNAAVALGVAFFALRVVGDGLVAALAAWLVALLCVFPAYLVNWGRYTQAAGLVLLPVAAALCLDALGPTRSRARAARATLAAGLAASGLLLAHYRMAAMLAPLVAFWVVYIIINESWHNGSHARRPRWAVNGTDRAAGVWCGILQAPQPLLYHARQRAVGDQPLPCPGGARRTPWSTLARCANGIVPVGAAALVAGLLALPWLVRLLGALSLGLGQQPGDYGADYYGLERLGTAVAQPTNAPLLMLAALGLALAWVLRRQPTPGGTGAVLVLGTWAVAQLALANPRWWAIPLPLAGRVDLVTTIAALCFPLAVAAALALAVAWRVALRRWGRRGLAVGLAAGLGASALGGWQLQALVTPNNALVAPADLAAAAWLRAHTPPEARVAASAVIFPWAPDYVAGVDAGYWLPLLADRATTVLPMLYPGERGADPQAVAQMVAVARALRDAPAAPATAALLRAEGVGYVYHSGRSPVPSVEALASNPALRLLYDQGGIRIWAVVAE